MSKSPKLEVVETAADAEHADVAICILFENGKLLFPDNKTGTCSKCFRMVQFRPDGPVTPKRLCVDCGMKDMAAHQKAGDHPGFIATEKTMSEVAAFLAKKKMH